MEFHRARMVRMAGAAAPAMPKHRQAGATNQAGRSSATAGGLGPTARGVEGLGRSSGYGPRPSPGGSARPKAMKPHENLPDRLSGQPPLPSLVALSLAKAPAVPAPEAEVEFLDVLVLAQCLCLAVQHDPAVLENVAIGRVLERDVG